MQVAAEAGRFAGFRQPQTKGFFQGYDALVTVRGIAQIQPSPPCCVEFCGPPKGGQFTAKSFEYMIAARLPATASQAHRSGLEHLLVPSPARKAWGRSSAGRASRSQCEGWEFDPPRLHHSAALTARCAGIFLITAPRAFLEAHGDLPALDAARFARVLRWASSRAGCLTGSLQDRAQGPVGKANSEYRSTLARRVELGCSRVTYRDGAAVAQLEVGGEGSCRRKETSCDLARAGKRSAIRYRKGRPSRNRPRLPRPASRPWGPSKNRQAPTT